MAREGHNGSKGQYQPCYAKPEPLPCANLPEATAHFIFDQLHLRAIHLVTMSLLSLGHLQNLAGEALVNVAVPSQLFGVRQRAASGFDPTDGRVRVWLNRVLDSSFNRVVLELGQIVQACWLLYFSGQRSGQPSSST